MLMLLRTKQTRDGPGQGTRFPDHQPHKLEPIEKKPQTDMAGDIPIQVEAARGIGIGGTDPQTNGNHNPLFVLHSPTLDRPLVVR
jgi:hypothetical protein